VEVGVKDADADENDEESLVAEVSVTVELCGSFLDKKT
jgi:hypothetical protein